MKLISHEIANLLAFSGLLGFLAACSSASAPDSPSTGGLASAEDTLVLEQAPDSGIFSILGVGDIMLGTNFPSEAYLPPNNDCAPLLASVRDSLRSASLTFGNLEGTFLDKGGQEKVCEDPSVCYAFRSPSSYFACLVDAGFDLFSMANNHAGDFGPEGIENTRRLIEAAGLLHAGLLAHPVSIGEFEGRKVGLCAFAPNNGTCDLRDLPEAIRIVQALDSVCDIVVLSFHGGGEGRGFLNLRGGIEWYVGENRGDVQKFAHRMVEAGADLIFGHGPHVPRALECYKGRMIAYSLGNFCTYSRMNLDSENGWAPMLKVYLEKDGSLRWAQIISARQIDEKGTLLDPEMNAATLMRRLTQTDLPNSGLAFKENGVVVPVQK